MRNKIEAPVWQVVGHGITTVDRRAPIRKEDRGPEVLIPCFVYDPNTNDYIEQPASDLSK